MKNKTHGLIQRSQNEVPGWLYNEIQEEDFLLGKTPKDLTDTWEEEE